ncbi:hypothetical protein QF042_001040 [Pedobacter sp. W3I1]|uniref:hypothetical protein n=1 Tax=Pedobacter sp. W3I1 TaxID=3042291 RepID=UPI002787A3E1|nr:hypothetical protein [Pedobacter sp. W3I1]MDQ0637475.1 hypothetical protein [Pedobacter sp. W3I1]
MKKQWKELGEGGFAFSVNGEEIGKYYKGDDWHKEPATFNILRNKYSVIYSYGLFSGYNTKILNELGESILQLKSIPFSLNYRFEYQNRRFKLVFSDARLWQWTIMENENPILSYGSDLKKGISGLLIESQTDMIGDYLFDFLLGHFILGKEKKDVYE